MNARDIADLLALREQYAMPITPTGDAPYDDGRESERAGVVDALDAFLEQHSIESANNHIRCSQEDVE